MPYMNPNLASLGGVQVLPSPHTGQMRPPQYPGQGMAGQQAY